MAKNKIDKYLREEAKHVLHDKYLGKAPYYPSFFRETNISSQFITFMSLERIFEGCCDSTVEISSQKTNLIWWQKNF